MQGISDQEIRKKRIIFNCSPDLLNPVFLIL